MKEQLITERALEGKVALITGSAQGLGMAMIHGKCGLSPEMAVRIAKATNTSPESWLAMQSKPDLWQAMQDEPKDIIKFESSISVQ